ncbi:MAG: hypothetical protein HRF45_00130 [Fimbriimonadia bacterium]|jgi:hypothetical protein
MYFAALLALLTVQAKPTDTLFLPLAVADKVVRTESTKLDIGDPSKLFDHDRTTLIRTPAINPAFVRVEFREPIAFEAIRLHLIDEEHTWSLAAADSWDDLVGKRDSYRMLVTERKGKGEVQEVQLAGRTSARAFQLDVHRLTGDDYVHIAEWQFCAPGRIEILTISQVTDRRQAAAPAGRREVTGAISKPTQTVIWLKAEAQAGEVRMDVSDKVRWSARGKGLKAFGDTPGMFVIEQVGEGTLTARFGDLARNVTVFGTERRIQNRLPDIDVWYIERLPRIPYDGPNEGMPLPDSNVTWRAHVYNWGTAPLVGLYEWKLDGKVVKSGRINLPVGPPSTQAVTVDLPWKWDPKRHQLTFSIQPLQRIAEAITQNNSLTIDTDAILVGAWVEQSLWEFHHEHQMKLPTKDANSFAGWMQRMMRQWNKMFVQARFREYPNGIQERVRLDRLVIVPDFGLPLAGGLPSNNPDLRDKTVDITWGYESGDIGPGTTVDRNHWWSPERAIEALDSGRVQRRQEDPPFWCGLGYIHEMNHARYLVDSYGFNVHSGSDEDIGKRNIRVTDEVGPILGRYMPLDVDIQHRQKYEGQMGGDYWKFSVFEAMCWERVRGKRARGGNCNAPTTIGEFLQDMPAKMIYRYRDEQGRPLAGAEVVAYRARGTGSDWYTKVYEDEPAFRTRADDQGRAVLNRTIWEQDGKVHHTYGIATSVALVRVTYQGKHYFLFEEVTDPNIAYNLGHKDEYTFLREIRLRSGDPSPAEWDPAATWQPPGTGFGLPVGR